MEQSPAGDIVAVYRFLDALRPNVVGICGDIDDDEDDDDDGDIDDIDTILGRLLTVLIK